MAATRELSPASLPLSPSPFLVLAGPSAVGKSEVALHLAQMLQGEIVSVDSMQVYRGLNIGTAKPSTADRARVPHHLIDVADLNEPFDAAKFSRLAHQAVREILSRQHVPILCGGTGLYFKSFLEGLGKAPPASPELRAALEATPLSALLHELAERDPATYETIDRQNPRRVIRAVEVIRLTGKPFSQQRAAWQKTSGTQGTENREAKAAENPADPAAFHLSQPTLHNSRFTTHVSPFFGLIRSNSDLHRRIAARVEEMFRNGLLEETERLIEHGLTQNRTAMQALGYRQAVEHLQGKRSLPETIDLVKIRTRQFTKRQLTWFRRQMDLNWLNLTPTDSAQSAADIIAAACKG